MNWLDYVGTAELQEDDARQTERKLKDGLTVHCQPDPTDPMIMERQHRAVCLHRPHVGCSTCPHASFVLAFTPNRDERLEVVACPRWDKPGDREQSIAPDKYVATELSTCGKAPFDFCSMCPSRREVEELGADKKSAGWYGRWLRLRKEEIDG